MENNNLTIVDKEEEKKAILATLKNSLYPGAKDESVAMVLDYCKAAKLDPLHKPVHIVPMSVKVGKDYEYRDVIMPGIGLYRIQASRSGCYAGVTEPEFGDDITETLGGVKVTYPEWCKVTVKKIVQGTIVEFSAKEYWIENYATASKSTNAPNSMWQKRPHGQLNKCAEAQALRKAFPEFITQQPTAEEMEGKVFNEFDHEPKNITPSEREIIAEQRQATIERTAQEELIVEEYKQLCADNNFDPNEFAKIAGINSRKIETIKNALDNFEIYKIKFLGLGT